jgi:NTP pyrophosphatase (non-canonical NTP hydrolase)
MEEKSAAAGDVNRGYRQLFRASTLKDVQAQLCKELENRLRRHGCGLFVSAHETYGVLAEEVDELLGAVRGNDIGEIRAELYDVAIAAIWGIVSTYEGIAPDIETETVRVLRERNRELSDELRNYKF